MKKSIRCTCGKLLAREEDGKIYVWCKSCKREIELKIGETKTKSF